MTVELKNSRLSDAGVAFGAWGFGVIFLGEWLEISEHLARGHIYVSDLLRFLIAVLLGGFCTVGAAHRMETEVDVDDIRSQAFGWKRVIQWSGVDSVLETKGMFEISYRTNDGKMKRWRFGKSCHRSECWQNLLDMVQKYRPDLSPPIEISKASQ